MIFRQLFDKESSTYTYLVADEISREAVLIDPVREQLERDLALLEELGLTLKYTLDTHVHADHVTASGLLREHTGCCTGVSGRGGAHCADLSLRDGDTLTVGGLEIRVLETPGHTNGCLSYHVGDRVFTGDTLLIRGTGRTDFQQGDAGKLYDSVTQKIFTLPDETFLYPGHDYRGHLVSTVGEEKRFNPRLTEKTRDQFIEIMANLNLAQPKKLQEAVPANLQCGMNPNDPALSPQLQRHAVRTPHDHWDLMPEGLRRHLGAVRVIDVREPSEFNDALAHIPGAELVPMGALSQEAQGWERGTPLVLVCRSGRRSATGARTLRELGFQEVYNLSGGMLAWNQNGFPTEVG